MGLSVKAGSFTSNTVTGNQAVTGVGFQPKVVLFMSADRTAAGSAAAGQPIFGVAVSASEQWAIAGLSVDNAANADTFRHAHNDRCLHHGNGAGAINMELDFVSHDSDGFTVNVTDAPSSALIVPYLALGGTDISVKAGTFNLATSGDPQSVTGVGFEPDLVILGHIGETTWPQTNAQHMLFGMGAFTASQQASFAVADQDTAGTMVTNAYQRSDSIALACFTDGEQFRCTFTSMDSDGFTFGVPNLPSAAATIGYLAISGGRWKVGVETKATSVTTKATTGVGFQPTGLMLFGAMKTSDTSVVPESRTTIGWSDGTSQFQTASASNDGVGTSNTSRRLSTTKIVGRIAGGETLNSEADVDSFDSDGFTLDWTTADAPAHEFIYLAMAADVVASTFLPKVLVI